MRHDAEGTDVCWAVVRAVADARDVDPIELEPPLSAVVDPDALTAFVDDRSGTEGRVSFRYGGCLVSVHRDGRVRVRDDLRAE